MKASLNLDRVAKNKEDILAVRQELHELVLLGREAFLADKKNALSLKYLLIQVVEAITDTCQHILSKLRGLGCEGYVDCIIKAGENGIITKPLSNKLRKLADLRNILVHRYWIINNEEIYNQCQGNIGDLEDFANQIDDLLKTS